MPDITDVLNAVEKLEAEYEELEGTEVPDTLKEAVAQRWELTVAAIQIVGLTAYLPSEYEPDSRRSITLRRALSIMGQLEERMIKETVIKPQVIAERAFWSNTFGMKKVIFDAAKEIYQAVKIGFETRSIVTAVLSAIAGQFLKSLNLIALPEILKAFQHGMKIRDEVAKQMRENALPQRSVRRYRVRREARQ